MNKSNLQKWKTTKSEYLITDRWIRLRADVCVAPDGHVFDPWYVLEYPDWVTCVVLSEDLEEITLLQHFRQGIGDYVIEVPGGVIDKDESPDQCVARELEEELGLVEATIHKVGVTYANPSMQNNKDHCYVAIGGTYKEQKLEPGDTFHPIKMPLAELLAKIEDPNTVMQTLHLTTIFFALNFLKKQKSQ